MKLKPEKTEYRWWDAPWGNVIGNQPAPLVIYWARWHWGEVYLWGFWWAEKSYPHAEPTRAFPQWSWNDRDWAILWPYTDFNFKQRIQWKVRRWKSKIS